MYYKLKLRDSVKTAEKVWRGVTISKNKTTYAESQSEHNLTKAANRVGIDALTIATPPERDENGDHVAVQRIL